MVPLKDEIRHIRNYMRIQELRFPGKLSFRLSMPEYLKDTRIPPLIIQTFIENSIKHAITPDASIDINVCMELEEAVDSEPLLKIRITDTGSGFSEEVLSEISKGNRIVDEHGEHIGIWNVKRRLGLLYGDAARLHVSNHEPSGARIELVLPIQASS